MEDRIGGITMILKNLFKRKPTPPRIIQRSNIIQYDSMGYPLRLCIVDNDQLWVDTNERDDDLLLKWEEEEEWTQ